MSDRTIDPTWDRMIIHSINSHFGYHLREKNGIFLVYMNQDAPNYAELQKWVEISLFGPIYDFQVREVSAMIQVQLRAFMKSVSNIYEMSDLTGLLTNVATMPINVPDLGRCLDNQGVRSLPKGRIKSEHASVAAEVTATYTIKLKE